MFVWTTTFQHLTHTLNKHKWMIVEAKKEIDREKYGSLSCKKYNLVVIFIYLSGHLVYTDQTSIGPSILCICVRCAVCNVYIVRMWSGAKASLLSPSMSSTPTMVCHKTKHWPQAGSNNLSISHSHTLHAHTQAKTLLTHYQAERKVVGITAITNITYDTSKVIYVHTNTMHTMTDRIYRRNNMHTHAPVPTKCIQNEKL